LLEADDPTLHPDAGDIVTSQKRGVRDPSIEMVKMMAPENGRTSPPRRHRPLPPMDRISAAPGMLMLSQAQARVAPGSGRIESVLTHLRDQIAGMLPLPQTRMMSPSSGRIEWEQGFIYCRGCVRWVESPVFYECLVDRGYRICAECEARLEHDRFHDPEHAWIKHRALDQ